MNYLYRGALGFRRPLPKHPTPFQSFRIRVAKYERFLSLVGLMIIFLTYAVKELVLETLRDEHSALVDEHRDYETSATSYDQSGFLATQIFDSSYNGDPNATN